MRIRVIAMTVLMAALLAACGGSSSTATTDANLTRQFKAAYEKARGPLNQTGDAIAAELQRASNQTDAQLEAEFRQLSSRFESQTSELETLKPPPSLAADWNSLTDSAKRVESDLTAIIAAAATHSKSAGEQAGASLAIDAGELQAAGATVKLRLGLK